MHQLHQNVIKLSTRCDLKMRLWTDYGLAGAKEQRLRLGELTTMTFPPIEPHDHHLFLETTSSRIRIADTADLRSETASHLLGCFVTGVPPLLRT